MRIGVLGGSFDPPHVGHVVLAQDAINELQLDRLFVIPTSTQPLKGRHRSSAADRVAMARLAFRGLDRVEVDTLEVDRGGISYTVDTLRALRLRYPAATLLLLLGADAVRALGEWREPAAVVDLAELVVLQRGSDVHAPGSTPSAAGEGDGGAGIEHTIAGVGVVRARRLSGRRIDVSSTEIRARINAGHSITGFVTDGVAQYIIESGLYRSEYVTS